MKRIRKLWYRWFPRYRYIQRACFTYSMAEYLLSQSEEESREEEKWVIDTEYEDHNYFSGVIYLCRRIRITE